MTKRTYGISVVFLSCSLLGSVMGTFLHSNHLFFPVTCVCLFVISMSPGHCEIVFMLWLSMSQHGCPESCRWVPFVTFSDGHDAGQGTIRLGFWGWYPKIGGSCPLIFLLFFPMNRAETMEDVGAVFSLAHLLEVK